MPADPVTPTGSLSTQISGMETLLSMVDAWQEWVEVDDGTDDEKIEQAKESIFVGGLMPLGDRPGFTAEELQELRPFAVIDFDNNGRGFQFASVSQGQYPPQGTILVAFEDNVLEEDAKDFKAAAYAFLNRVSAVLEEMLTTASEGTVGDVPIIRAASVRYGPRRADPKKAAAQGDHWVAVIGFEIGAQ